MVNETSIKGGKMLKSLILVLAGMLGSSAFAFEPLVAFCPQDPDYGYYSSVLAVDQKLVNEGVVTSYTDIDLFNVNGRIVTVVDGSLANPMNLVLGANGNMYYIFANLNSVDNFKIRRRGTNNPEPGVFLRVEGTRRDERTFRIAPITVWIKIATPEGRALPVLKVFEGDYDLK